MQELIDHVFEVGYATTGPQYSGNSNTPCGGTDLAQFVQSHVNQVESQFWSKKLTDPPTPAGRGRVGPSKVRFADDGVGKYSSNTDPMGIIAKDNFVSVLTKTGVCEGRWQYEVCIGSCGVIQIGWAAPDCCFTAEKGVGDTPTSYSYDGSRQRAWNVLCSHYGDVWQSDDVITCLIDMDQRTMSYRRNGKDLGVAFRDFPTGKDVALFPALSISKGEYVIVNFGEAPMQYPVPGYAPLQDAPEVRVATARMCLRWLGRLLDRGGGGATQGRQHQPAAPSHQLLLSHSIMAVLAPLLLDADTGTYVIQDALLPHLRALLPVGYMEGSSDYTAAEEMVVPQLGRLLDVLHAVLEEEEWLKVFQRLKVHLVTQCRQPSVSSTFPRHKGSIRLLGALLAHRRTRRVALEHMLFSGGSLQNLLCFSIDGALLRELVPVVHWTSSGDTSPPVGGGDEGQYQQSLQLLDGAIADVERLHVSLLLLLLTVEPDCSYTSSTRYAFLRGLRCNVLKGHLTMAKYNTPVMVQLFHALLQAFSILWLRELPPSQRQHLPLHLYYHTAPLDLPSTVTRLGGLHSFLAKKFSEQIQRACPAPSQTKSSSIHHNSSRRHTGTESWFDDVTNTETDGCEGVSDMDVDTDYSEHSTSSSLHHLADSLLMLYHYCVHRTLVRVGVARETRQRLIARVAAVTARLHHLRQLEGECAAALTAELQSTLAVLRAECDRHVAMQSWPTVQHFAPRKLAGYINLLQLTANTIQAASDTAELFTFLPEYYMDVLSDLALGLLVDNCRLDGYDVTHRHSKLYQQVVALFCRHFSDHRICFTDSKELLVQSVASLVSCRDTLAVLHTVSDDSRRTLVRSLLQSYDNRVWAQNNWILVRFWKGSGFAYRYFLSPHLKDRITPKPTHSDVGSQHIEPRPSPILQRDVATVLSQDAAFSAKFVNSLLNQLNWTFSEFVGMLQEIQNYCARTERVFIDSRQLRVCSTCFDLTVSLLRVLEMVVCVAPQLFVAQDGEHAGHAELLRDMLCKLLCHVINRISAGGGSKCFSLIASLDIPGLDCLHQFPVLTAAAGILTGLLREDLLHRDNPNHVPVATKSLVKEPNFQLSSFEALLDVSCATSLITPAETSSGSASTSTASASNCKAESNCAGAGIAAAGASIAAAGASNAVAGASIAAAGASIAAAGAGIATNARSPARSNINASESCNVGASEVQIEDTMESISRRDGGDIFCIVTSSAPDNWAAANGSPLLRPPPEGPDSAAMDTTDSDDPASSSVALLATDQPPLFSLKNYPDDVTTQELALLSSCLSYLAEYQARPTLPSPSDGYLDCIICYASRATCTFQPCGHTSCRACVSQHLLSQNGCFFCMVDITTVKEEVSGTLFKNTRSSGLQAILAPSSSASSGCTPPS